MIVPQAGSNPSEGGTAERAAQSRAGSQSQARGGLSQTSGGEPETRRTEGPEKSQGRADVEAPLAEGLGQEPDPHQGGPEMWAGLRRAGGPGAWGAAEGRPGPSEPRHRPAGLPTVQPSGARLARPPRWLLEPGRQGGPSPRRSPRPPPPPGLRFGPRGAGTRPGSGSSRGPGSRTGGSGSGREGHRWNRAHPCEPAGRGAGAAGGTLGPGNAAWAPRPSEVGLHSPGTS